MGESVREMVDLFEGTSYAGFGQVGRGGMGTVYLVEHRHTGRKCVAKVIHSHFLDDPRVVDRLRLEAQTLGRLMHPHIVEVLGAEETSDGRPFLVLEYLKGRTLGEAIHQDGPLPPPQALRLALQCLSALQAAHERGVIHRDLKPANIFLVDDEDGPPVAKVLDFGLAKVLPDAPTGAPTPLLQATTQGYVVGTPQYMSPEGLQGGQVDRSSDVYAAAAVIYKMLTGAGPFDHTANEGALTAKVHEEPAPPSRLAPWPIPKKLDEVVLRGLSPTPSERFVDAEHFRAALSECVGEVQRTDLTPARSEFKTLAILAMEMMVVGMVLTAVVVLIFGL